MHSQIKFRSDWASQFPNSIKAKTTTERIGSKVVFPAEITTFSRSLTGQIIKISNFLVNKNQGYLPISYVRKNNE